MALLTACLTGLVLPLVLKMLTRHYDANPNAWEKVYVTGAIGALMVIGGCWAIAQIGQDKNFFIFLVGILVVWSILIGLFVVTMSLSDARDLIRETRSKGKQE